jgi:Leucine-rich repeat (LRR) protein
MKKDDHMYNLNSISIVHFPSRTSQKIADYALSQFSALFPRVSKTCMATPDREPHTNLDHVVVIFPILGDDRIPELAEDWLITKSASIASHSVCITGDFRGDELEDNPVAIEAERLLQTRGSHLRSPSLLVDTPVDDNDLEGLIRPWLIGQLGQPENTSAASDTDRQTLPERLKPRPSQQITDQPLKEILSVLPIRPHFSLDSEGQCTSLSFIDSAPYSRSLLRNLTRKQLGRIVGLVGEMTHLENLGLPFAGLRGLDLSLPESLEKLDLRGNYLDNYEFAMGHHNVALVNLAACDLVEPPKFLRTLPNLHTLILAKNRIDTIPRWFSSLEALERLTLYRNLLSGLGIGMHGLASLRVLNLGANPPLEDFEGDLSNLRSLEVLGLRLLDLHEVPQVLYELPRLQWVDMSKNPVFYQSDLSHPSITFADRMPRWDWSQKSDHQSTSLSGVKAN